MKRKILIGSAFVFGWAIAFLVADHISALAGVVLGFILGNIAERHDQSEKERQR